MNGYDFMFWCPGSLFYLSLLDTIFLFPPHTFSSFHTRPLPPDPCFPVYPGSQRGPIFSLVLSHPPLLLSSVVITAVVVTGPFTECRPHKRFRDDIRILKYFTPNLEMSALRLGEVK